MNAVHYFWKIMINTDDLLDGVIGLDEWQENKEKLHNEADGLGLTPQLDALFEQMKRDGIQSIPTK